MRHKQFLHDNVFFSKLSSLWTVTVSRYDEYSTTTTPCFKDILQNKLRCSSTQWGDLGSYPLTLPLLRVHRGFDGHRIAVQAPSRLPGYVDGTVDLLGAAWTDIWFALECLQRQPKLTDAALEAAAVVDRADVQPLDRVDFLTAPGAQFARIEDGSEAGSVRPVAECSQHVGRLQAVHGVVCLFPWIVQSRRHVGRANRTIRYRSPHQTCRLAIDSKSWTTRTAVRSNNAYHHV